MKLQVFNRTGEKKGESKKLRAEGKIPAAIYVRGKPSETISIQGNEFTSLLRKVTPGRLSTTVFELVEDHGKARPVLVKEIQYDPTTYNVIHLDFEELFDDVKINAKVPIECIGILDCLGTKQGGVLRQVIRSVRVRCLPKDLPEYFQLDVKNLGIREVKRLSDLDIPQTVRPLADLKEVAVVIAKR